MEASTVPRLAPAGVSVINSPQLLRLASDQRLVALVREGRSAAFEAVYDRHHRGILSFCRHMLGDAQEAEDAVQHTFLAAYNDLISSRKPIHLKAWLFTIARNRCYSILRARREQPAADLDEAVTEGLAVQVQRRQDLRDLVVDMRSLPEDQRAALVLAELESLSHEQIGEALGVPREKVKALVFQARESLVASRTARETDCGDIREQLATQRGGALRRANLRRHLRDCAGCREFRKQIERQRHQLAILLPVAPTLALKEGVLAATVGTGATVGIAGGSLVFTSALKSGALKTVIGAVLAGVGTAGTIVATHGQLLPFAAPSSPTPPAVAQTAPSATGQALSAGSGPSSDSRAERPSSFGARELPRPATPAAAAGGRLALPTGGASFNSSAAGVTLRSVIQSTAATIHDLPIPGKRSTGGVSLAAPVPAPSSAGSGSSGEYTGTQTAPTTPAASTGTANGTGQAGTKSSSSTRRPSPSHTGNDGGYGGGASSHGAGSSGGSTRGQGSANGPDAVNPGSSSGSGEGGGDGGAGIASTEPSSSSGSGSVSGSGSGGAGIGSYTTVDTLPPLSPSDSGTTTGTGGGTTPSGSTAPAPDPTVAGTTAPAPDPTAATTTPPAAASSGTSAGTGASGASGASGS